MVDLPAVAFVAPLAALAGVAVGPYITSRTEERRWRREQRASAATALLKAIAALDPAYWLNRDPDVDELAQLMTAADLASDVFSVYFSGDVVSVAHEAVEAAIARELVSSRNDEKKDERSEKANRTRKALLEALARELGEKPRRHLPWR